MRMIQGLGATAAALAMVGMAVPADASGQRRGNGHGPNQGRGHRGGDRIDGGDLLLGALLAGGVIAIASAAGKKSRNDARYAEDAGPPPSDADAGADHLDDAMPAPPPGNGPALAESDAADACAEAAESRASEYARVARVSDIGSVDPAGNGGWYVQGTIELRDGYRDTAPRHERFRCSVGGSGVPSVRIDNAPDAPPPLN